MTFARDARSEALSAVVAALVLGAACAPSPRPSVAVAVAGPSSAPSTSGVIPPSASAPSTSTVENEPPPIAAASGTSAAAAPPSPERIDDPAHAAWVKGELAKITPFCLPAIAKTDATELVGCACCPPFDACPPKPGAKPAIVDSVFALDFAIDGAFSAPGADERALVFQGCESHAQNYGGTLFVARPGAAAHRTPVYRSGLHPSKCLVLHEKGENDRLVCRFDDAHMGEGEESVFVYDDAKPDDDSASTTLLYAIDSMSACNAENGATIVEERVREMSVHEAKAGHPAEIDLLLAVRTGTANAVYKTRCEIASRAADKGVPSPSSPADLFGTPALVTLAYVETANRTFAATAETAERLKKLVP